jgi:hypothetical protein
MPVHEGKQNKDQSAPQELQQKKSGTESGQLFVDSRQETLAQRKLQHYANNSEQVKTAAGLHAMFNSANEIIEPKTVHETALDIAQTSTPVQRAKLHTAPKMDKGYHAYPNPGRVQKRIDIFAELRAPLITFRARFQTLKDSLDRFLAEIELAPAGANPITVKIGQMTTLIDELAKAPTLVRWDTCRADEAALLGLDDKAIVPLSYAYEKARIITQIKKIRRDTVGRREAILSQMGMNDNWMTPAQKTGVTKLRNIKAEVDALIVEAEAASDWTDYELLPAKFSTYQQAAEAATDVPFAVELAAVGWEDAGAEVPDPRQANNYFQQHILDRHAQSSPAAGAGKFNTDTWATIRGWINTAKAAAAWNGPIFNAANGHPNGRFECTHNIGAAIGTTIAGAASTTIFLVASRSGKSIVTAYPV